MHRLMVAVALAFAIAPIHSALAEIEVVKVTPEYLKENDQIRVVTEHASGAVAFTVRLHFSEPQYVTTKLIAGAVQFAAASVITEPETEVRFAVRKENIGGTTLYLGVGGFNLKDGVAKPWLGGTSYVIRAEDFAQEPSKSGDRKALESGRSNPAADGFAVGGVPPLAFTNEPDGTNPAATGGEASLAKSDEEVRSAIAATKLVEVHASEDSIDTSRTIQFRSKAGKVEVRPGSSLLIELPRPTKEFSWHAGDAPESVGDADLPTRFTHVWCRWQADGKVTWKCYGPR